jgi:CheY-like chemotaxis protein
MVRLAEDLVEASRITLGKIEFRREIIDVRDALRTALDGVAAVVEAGRHELHVEVPSEPLPMSGDPVRLAQIFMNLLNNSLKYTPDGGFIWVSARRESDEWMRVSVRDSGIGITEEVLPHVFDMFTQGGDLPVGHARSGLGVGLTLVRTLVDGHGGTVQVLSQGRGKGTEVIVRLPLSPARPTEAPQEALPIALDRQRVLVVDDNRDAADSLGELLRMFGADVDVAYSAATALNLHRGREHAIAFVDLGMPLMDGFEFARRLRASDGNTTLVAVTGWGQDHDRASTREAGFNDHLVKPVDPARLREVLASIVHKKT